MQAKAERSLPSLIPGLVLGCLACTGTPDTRPADLPLVQMDLRTQLTLCAPDGGPVSRLAVTVLITPLDGEPFTVSGVRESSDPNERGLLDLEVRWTDFRGDQPSCAGQSLRFLLPLGQGGVATPEAPLAIAREVQLPLGPAILARRVRAQGRIIGVDLQRQHAHTGGTLLDLPETQLETFAAVPAGSLEDHLQSRSAAGIFLSAVSAPAERRDEVLETLIEALPATPEPARAAAFAALLYLTGETHGCDMYRWSSWWKERAAAPPKG